MSFNIIFNLIIVFSVLGILVLFLRRIPEVVDEKGQLKVSGGHSAVVTAEMPVPVKFASQIWEFIKEIFSEIGRSVWHFMLEAKDLKEGRILASNFSKIVATNTKKVVNIAAFSQLRKADKLIGSGQLNAAEEVYFEIIKKHPHEYPAYEGLIRIYTKQKKQSELIETLHYLISHNPANDNYYAQLGKTLLAGRRFADAAEAYDRSLELNSLIPSRFANAGLSYQAMGEFIKARKYFTKALDLEPGNVQYLMMLVEVLVRLDQRDEAVQRLESTLEIDPENTIAREKLIQLQK